MLVKSLCAASLLAGTVLAQSPVTVVVDTRLPGVAVPDDFAGLSFEASNLLPDQNGNHLFCAQNRPLIARFRGLGIKSLRIGGATADIARYPVPGPADIDGLFAFARAANVKVIYTLRLLNGDAARDAIIARYIWQRHRPQLACFALGNEPDWPSYHGKDPRITDYPSYLADWKNFAAAITNAAPGARIEGPCTGSNYPDPGAEDTDYQGHSWTWNFANDLKDSTLIAFVSQHDYPGQNGRRAASAAAARDQMLSPGWLDGYQVHYDAFAPAALAAHLPYRLEEVSNFSGGVAGASDTFAAALWALDFMHWWAAHRADGVNFHNRRHILNAVIHPLSASAQNYAIYPVGYGIKAFDLGGHGRALPLTISNADDVNLTAYAVRGAGKLFVTLINKKHGPGARDAAVTIVADGIARRAQMIVLAAPDDDVAAKTGVTLGGGIIGDDGLWRGKWKTIQANRRGRCILEMPAATAAVLKLDTSRFSRRQRRGPVKRAGHRRQKRIAGTSSANHKSDGTRRWISSFPHQPKT